LSADIISSFLASFLMALAGETLREFLIGISYGINQASEEAAKASMKRVEQADKRLVEATRENNRDLEILNRRRAEEAEAHARRFAENVNNHIVGALRRVVTEIGAPGSGRRLGSGPWRARSPENHGRSGSVADRGPGPPPTTSRT
jgi:hypothetical protein